MRKKAIILLLLLLPAVLAGCSDDGYYEKNGYAMGAAVSIKLYDSDNAAAIAADAIEQIREADSRLSPHLEGSDIFALNASKTGTSVSAYTISVLESAVQLCNLTGGVLDITLGAVTRLWGFDTQTPSLPDPDALAAALQTVDVSALLLDRASKTVAKEEGQLLDLGALGKGVACRDAAAALRRELSPAIVSVGGTVLLYRNNPDAPAWSVGIRDPRGDANDWFATLSLTVDTASDCLTISTSGAYEKTFTENGVAYHHILSPQTGMPVETGLLSVTVVCESGLLSDGLSTALFATGLNAKAAAILDNYLAEAVFVTADGGCYVTDGLLDRIALTAEGYTLHPLAEALGETP